MEDSEQRDNTQDWLVPSGVKPLSVGEMEERIEEAMALARSSEVRSEATQSAVVAIGESALDAARQARRAAGAAERAAERAADAQQRVARIEARGERAVNGSPAAPVDESLREFTQRADRVMRRLRDLGCEPAPRRTVGNGRPAA